MELSEELVTRNMAKIETHMTSKHVIVDWVVLFLMLDQTTEYDTLKQLFEKEFRNTNLKILLKRGWIKFDKSTRLITAHLEMLSDTMRMALADFEEGRATRAQIQMLESHSFLDTDLVETPFLISLGPK